MTTYPLLLSASELFERIDDPTTLVVDATVGLTREAEGAPYRIVSGRDSYDRGHISGAVFADLITEFSDPDGAVQFALPTPERFSAAAQALGIGVGIHVVVYTQDLPTFAPRLWWELRYFGFDSVSVLDGGLPAWRADGLPITDQVSAHRTAAPFAATPQQHLIARRAEVEKASANSGATCLVNALSPAEFAGEGAAPDARAGRIPGSVNVPWYKNIDRESGLYRSPQHLADSYSSAGIRRDAPVITYCGGGIAASMDAFALALAGYENVRVYDGSLSEWNADPSLPLVRG